MPPTHPASLMKPAQYAEDRLLRDILSQTWPPGAALPSERQLANAMGVTRPTLREVLQRLSREGWITIRHGKPTLVNDYWRTGGLGLLSTMARYSEYAPLEMITHLLEFRAALLPAVARLAAARHPTPLLELLQSADALPDAPQALADFDWRLQVKMAEAAGNPLFCMLINDFEKIFHTQALTYFSSATLRDLSRGFYQELRAAIMEGGPAAEAVVRRTMNNVLELWQN